MEAATFQQILPQPHTHASRLTTAWGKQRANSLFPMRMRHFGRWPASAAPRHVPGWGRPAPRCRCGGGANPSWNRPAPSLHPARAGAAGPTASPTGPARLSGNLRCQAGIFWVGWCELCWALLASSWGLEGCKWRKSVSEKKYFAGTVVRPRWPLGRAFLGSILQHDPKTIQIDLMMGPTCQKASLCRGKTLFGKNDVYINQHGCTPHITQRRANASSYVWPMKLPTWPKMAPRSQAKNLHKQRSKQFGKPSPAPTCPT